MFCRATPYEGKEPYIFISYCHADKEQIYPLIEQMSLDGYRVWYDVGSTPGSNWLLNIEEHLENCKAVITFVSKHFPDANNCSKEIVYAIKCEKKIIPVLFEDTVLPKGLRMQLYDLHYLERKNFPSGKVLLQKCYESEACNACKDPSGTIPLRHEDAARPQKTPHKSRITDFISSLSPVERKPKMKESVSPSVPKEDAPKPVLDFAASPVSEKPNDFESEEEIYAGTVIIDLDESEGTVVPGCDLEEEKTVYGQDTEEEGTVLNGFGADYDDDKTVRISRNLAILLHPAEQQAYKLKSPKITLGRSQIRCDVAIKGNDSISKVHAFIRQTKQKCYIEDANSSNGTYVNGEQIDPGEQVPLDNPAVFQLNDETLILLSGLLARKFDKKQSVSLLINDEATAVRIMDSDVLPLNRNNKWPDGTLSDRTIHRAGHALLKQCDDGVYLVDETPEQTSGTYLNGSRLPRGASRLLSSGDKIRLGKSTTLEYISIEIPS